MKNDSAKPPHVIKTPDDIQRRNRPAYEPPEIVSYSSDEILEQVGPAQACSPAPCGIF